MARQRPAAVVARDGGDGNGFEPTVEEAEAEEKRRAEQQAKLEKERIEKERLSLFASRYRVFVNSRLVHVRQGT